MKEKSISFFVVKGGRLLLVVLVIIAMITLFCLPLLVSETSANFHIPNAKWTVVVDAGHGGIDGGCVGTKTGVTESELNLEYAFNLADQLKNRAISVVLTRSDAKGLYEQNVSNLKKSDMKKRREIIESTRPDLVVSLHMNSFPLRSCRGAQTFFKKGNESGKTFAELVQTQLHNMLDYAKALAKEGDFYIVTCTDVPSVLVECGFLSNAEEELLLQNKEYQNKICYAIVCGIVAFLTTV